MTKAIIRWRDRDLLNDPVKTDQYHTSVIKLVDSLLVDKNINCKIESLWGKDGEFLFAVYINSIESQPLISTIQGDVWRPGFRDYIVNAYVGDHSQIVSLLNDNRSVTRYIFQELMYRIVDQYDDYEIVSPSEE